ncbi:MAG: hypothetical protein M9890_11650 [Thermomicrobiales bacterium]|nr:hypothetical protein [Thermomicrobiales bacterium]
MGAWAVLDAEPQDQVDRMMQRDLAAAGIRVEFETLSDGNVFTTRHNEGNAGPMCSYNWGSYWCSMLTASTGTCCRSD